MVLGYLTFPTLKTAEPFSIHHNLNGLLQTNLINHQKLKKNFKKRLQSRASSKGEKDQKNQFEPH